MTVHPALAAFHEPVQRWFMEAFGAPTRAQELAWPAIHSGGHLLLVAPTGSGKTLSAFLSAIDHVMFEPVPAQSDRCRVLYVSPLKALAVDIERNLRAPIEGIADICRRERIPYHMPALAVRTGDTPSQERARFARRPADFLITTPESLYLILTSNARETLRSVRWVIVDEIHALAPTKRGTHLALSLERLEELVRGTGAQTSDRTDSGVCSSGDSEERTDLLMAAAPASRAVGSLQRIGLSATVRPLDEVARFLGGFDDKGRPRPVHIADAGSRKTLDLRVELAVADARAARARARPVVERVGAAQVSGSGNCSNVLSPSDEPPEKGLWPAVHPLLLDLIRAHRSTLIFVNNRRLAERMAAALNELAGNEIVRAHHGSIAREQRLEIEEALKAGRLPALIATSSLELGIDMGAIDLVVQIESPPSIASAMQRIGRAGHQVGVPSKGVIVPKHRGDLLACAAVTERMRAGAVETLRYPRNPLDALAQQVVAMVAMDPWRVPDLERVIRRAAPYADLAPSLLRDVLDMLSGRYPSHDFTDLRPRITWDRTSDALTPREGARRVAVASGGTIPDRGLYGVFLADAPPGKGRVGELEEIMVFESRVGDVFLLGASSWRILDITHDRVIVAPAPGVPGRMPFWHGENVGRSLELGRAIGELTRRLQELPEEDANRLLVERHDLSRAAASDLLEYLERQRQATGAVPDDRTIVVERHRDEMGEWRICTLTPFGARVHAPWAMAIGAAIRDEIGIEPDLLWTDNGIVLRYPDADRPPPIEMLLPASGTVRERVVRQLAFGGGAARQSTQGAPVTAVFASRFREAAARALLLPNRKSGKRAPLWQTRKRAADLLHVVAKHRDFPIVLETYRECLQDVFDMDGLTELMAQIEAGEVRVIEADTPAPSPFAASMLFSYVANFMYEGDAPMAERRAQALTVDPVRLRQVLGEVELRELLDPEVLAEVEAELQCTTGTARARNADALHDMLLRLGDLADGEIADHCSDPDSATRWLIELKNAGRIADISVAGERRWVAVEDIALYRDALGTDVPAGIPATLLAPCDNALIRLVARYARRRGPFRLSDLATRYGIGVATARLACETPAAENVLIEGEFTPGIAGLEWCDTGVIRMLRSRTLARLRHEIEPVSQEDFVGFTLDWHGIGECAQPCSSSERLLDVIRRLQGAPIPASVLERNVLPARLPDYDSRDLDILIASGAVLWIGAGRLAENDGRIRLFTAEDAPLLLETYMEPNRLSDRAAQVLDHLRSSGASFFAAIVQRVGGFPPDVLATLWELVWLGLVTNDTLQPLRHLVDPASSRRIEEYARRRTGRFRPIPHGQTIAGRPIPATAGGRWTIVPEANPRVSLTDRRVCLTELLLERHGVLTREAVLAEGLEGGFTAIYDVLKAMEDAGRVRRGYFVAGLGATQFAVPEAVERLRSFRSNEPDRSAAILLAACDPANPFGAALPWPDRNAVRGPARTPGAYVVLQRGSPTLWLSRPEGRMVIFSHDAPDLSHAAATLMVAIEDGRIGPMIVSRIDDSPAAHHRAVEAFKDAGVSVGSRGLILRPGTRRPEVAETR